MNDQEQVWSIKMKKRFRQTGIRACLFGVVLFTLGCVAGGGGIKVPIQQDKYLPAFKSSEFGRFKGKKVILDAFTNSAGNTKSGAYYSPDKNLTYEASVQLESYFWYCFKKAFQHIGVNVLDPQYAGGRPYHYGYWGWGVPPPSQSKGVPGVTEFQFVLTSLTDQECKFQVSLFKNGESRFQKDFTVTMTPAQTQDVRDLEKRAYRMVDVVFAAIMKDRDFQKAF